jgi:hypothetical protein
MVEIEFVSPARRQIRTIAVKIVQRKPRRLTAEPTFQPFGQPAFTRSAASDNRNEQRALCFEHGPKMRSG